MFDMKGQRWTISEDEFLRKNWKKKSDEILAKTFGRNTISVKNRRRLLGLHGNALGVPWTEEENKKFRELYPISTKDELTKYFPNRRATSFATHADDLEVEKEANILQKIRFKASKKINTFSEKDKDKLRKLFDSGLTPKEIKKKFPSRTYFSIRAKLTEMRLVHRRKWTEKEKQLLSQIFFKESRKEILNKLPNRSWATIRSHAQKWGISRETKRKITDAEFIEAHNQGMRDCHIAKKFKMANGAVRERRLRLGLSKIPRPRKRFLNKTRFTLEITKEMEAFINAKKNVSGYIRGLIEKDMKKE